MDIRRFTGEDEFSLKEFFIVYEHVIDSGIPDPRFQEYKDHLKRQSIDCFLSGAAGRFYDEHKQIFSNFDNFNQTKAKLLSQFFYKDPSFVIDVSNGQGEGEHPSDYLKRKVAQWNELLDQFDEVMEDYPQYIIDDFMFGLQPDIRKYVSSLDNSSLFHLFKNVNRWVSETQGKAPVVGLPNVEENLNLKVCEDDRKMEIKSEIIGTCGLEQKVTDEKPIFFHDYMELVNKGLIQFEIQLLDENDRIIYFDENGERIDFNSEDYKPVFYDLKGNIVESDGIEPLFLCENESYGVNGNNDNNSGQVDVEIQTYDENFDLIDFNSEEEPAFFCVDDIKGDNKDHNINKQFELEIQAYDEKFNLTDFNIIDYTKVNHVFLSENENFDLFDFSIVDSEIKPVFLSENHNDRDVSHLKNTDEVMRMYMYDDDGYENVYVTNDMLRKVHSVTDDADFSNDPSNTDCVPNETLSSIVSENTDEIREDHRSTNCVVRENAISGISEVHALEDESVETRIAQEGLNFGKQQVGYEDRGTSASIFGHEVKIDSVSIAELELAETIHTIGKYGRENDGGQVVYKRTAMREKLSSQRILRSDVVKSTRNNEKAGDTTFWGKFHPKNWSFRRKLDTG